MESLGYVECNGLSGAIVAADRMLKTADVKLSSIQNTKGNGWVTLQVSGELSAVSVAVQAVKEGLPNVYVTSTVIGRPASGLDTLGKTDLLKPASEQKASKPAPAKAAVAKSAPVEDSVDKEVSEQPSEQADVKPVAETTSAAPAEDEQPTTEVSEKSSEAPASTAAADTQKVTDSKKEQKTTTADEKVTCNLCGDPKCPRKLGESHKKCIHYNELKKK